MQKWPEEAPTPPAAARPFSNGLAAARVVDPEKHPAAVHAKRLLSAMRKDPDAQKRATALLEAVNARGGKPITFPGEALGMMI